MKEKPIDWRGSSLRDINPDSSLGMNRLRRGTFGVYKGGNEFIYLRESY